jgi:hypothetical protein
MLDWHLSHLSEVVPGAALTTFLANIGIGASQCPNLKPEKDMLN